MAWHSCTTACPWQEATRTSRRSCLWNSELCVVCEKQSFSLTFLHGVLLWSQTQLCRVREWLWPLRAGEQTPESLHCVQHKVDKSAEFSSSQSLAGFGLNPRVFLCLVTLLICYIFLEESWERGAWVAHPSKNWVKSSGSRKKHFLEPVYSHCWVSTVGIFSKSKAICSNQSYEAILHRRKQVVFVWRGEYWLHSNWTVLIVMDSYHSLHKQEGNLLQSMGNLSFIQVIPQTRILKCMWPLPPVHQRLSTTQSSPGLSCSSWFTIHHIPEPSTGSCTGVPHGIVAKGQQLPHSGHSEEGRKTFQTRFRAKPSHHHLGQLSVSQHPLTACPQEVKPTRSPILCTKSLLS